MDDALVLQLGAVVVLNTAFAWLAGSWLARRWLSAAGAPRGRVEALLRPGDITAASLGALGTGAMLWATAAVMGGLGLQEATDLIWPMLTLTSIGRAGYLALFAMILVLLARAWRSAAPWREWTVLAALCGFAFVRASMGHAGEYGYWTLPFLAEVVHLAAMGAWTGLVAVSAWKAMSCDTGLLKSRRMLRYLDAMSSAALAAVVAVFATGLFNAWNRIGTVDNLFGNSVYSIALLIKFGLVVAALILGGYNKFTGLALARKSEHGLARVRFVLKVESIVLFAVLVAAAVLTSQQPPASM
jgi:copper resistance protein D